MSRASVSDFRLGVFALLVFDLILFAPLLTTNTVISSHDFVRAHHPWRMTDRGVLEAENRLLSDPAASGETTLVRFHGVPRAFFWNPWVSSGAMGPILLAQGFLSPFTLIPAMVLPEAGIETGILFLKFQFAFAAMYAFLRSRRFTDAAAATGAAAWAFSTGLAVWGLWMQSSVAVTYPLLLMSVDRAFDEGNAARALRFATLSALLCLAGGFPHWILFGGIAASLYLLLRAAAARGRGTLRAVGRLAAACAIAGALLLPAILATARFLRASDYGSLRRGMGASFALPLRHLRLYALPDYQGTPRRDDYRGVGWIPGDNYIEVSAGLGVAAVGLAFVGLASLGRRREGLFAAILGAAVAIPLYAGGGLLAAIGRLPLLDIGLFARAKILIVFAAAILAACGAESLERLAEARGLRRAVADALPFLVAVPLAFLALDFYPVCRPDEAVFADTPGIRRLREITEGGGRFAAAGWTLIPNVSEALEIEDARGHFLLDAPYRRLLSAADPSPFGRFGTYLVFDPSTLDTDSPVLDLLGVRALAAPPGARRPVGAEVESRDAAPFSPDAPASEGGAPPRADDAAARLVYDGPDMTLFERRGAFDRFWLVSAARPGGFEEARVASREELARAVFVPPADAARLGAPGFGSDTAAGAVHVVALSAERFAIETDAAAPTVLASSQKLQRPYWRIFVDGVETGAVTADGLFAAVPLPAGRHRVEGRFEMPRRELLVSAAGALALIVVLAAARRPRVRTA
ncbi:MAG TPA: hypothetical protein VH854_14870 [Thermoanaerobaculia bacterium]|nr:hypothetical protein [Thermoanaerobaculia bacterium]